MSLPQESSQNIPKIDKEYLENIPRTKVVWILSENLSYNYTMPFIGHDSIQTRLFIFYRFQISTVTKHQY